MVSPKQNVLNSHCLGLSSLHFCLHSLQTLVYWFIALCFDVIALLLVLLIFNVIRFVVAITPLKALTTHCDAHTPTNELKMCVEILCQNQLLPKQLKSKNPPKHKLQEWWKSNKSLFYNILQTLSWVRCATTKNKSTFFPSRTIQRLGICLVCATKLPTVHWCKLHSL